MFCPRQSWVDIYSQQFEVVCSIYVCSCSTPSFSSPANSSPANSAIPSYSQIRPTKSILWLIGAVKVCRSQLHSHPPSKKASWRKNSKSISTEKNKTCGNTLLSGILGRTPWMSTNTNSWRERTSSSAMAERPRELGDFKKARVNGGTDNQSL